MNKTKQKIKKVLRKFLATAKTTNAAYRYMLFFALRNALPLAALLFQKNLHMTNGDPSLNTRLSFFNSVAQGCHAPKGNNSRLNPVTLSKSSGGTHGRRT